jgi:hypothetical protein
MANTTAARLTVLQGVIGCIAWADSLMVGFGVVEDTTGQTRCILDQLFVVFGANTTDGPGDYCSEAGDNLIDQ